MAIEIGLLVVGLALSALAGALLKPKPTRNPISRSNTSPNYAERGSFIPYVLGTQRVGAVVAWVGKLRIKNKAAATGVLDKLFGNAGSTKTQISQDAWHILAVGPGYSLLKIYEGGKIIFPTKTEVALTPGTHPSGTLVTLKSGRGSFKIYWGENDQPIEAVLNTGTGVASRWPHCMYVLWTLGTQAKGKGGKKLSTTQWPLMEYEIEVHPETTNLLTLSDSWMTGDGGGPLAPFINNGANPGHALMQIINNTFPHGMGIPTDQIDLDCFEIFGNHMQDELQPINIYVGDGEEAVSVISDILSDCGAFLPQCGDQISVLAIRSQDPLLLPTIPDQALVPPLPEKEFVFGEKPADRLSFVYKDRELRFKDNDITIDDDSDLNGRSKIRKIELRTVIDKAIAMKVVDRRQQEELTAVRVFKISVGRGARQMISGQSLVVAGLGQLRVTGVERSTDSAKTILECIKDVYSPPASNFTLVGSGTPPTPPTDTPVRDTAYDFIELPPPYKINGMSIVALRLRANGNMFAALIDISIDAVNYINAATNEDFDFSGILDAALNNTDASVQNTGPIITATNETDNDLFEDLSTSDLRWRTGDQVCIIENEVCFFKNLVALGSFKYRIDGLIRARKGTEKVTHALGTRVWLMLRESITPIENSLLGKGLTLSLRAETIADDILSDAAALPVATHLLKGTTLAPYAPTNFRAERAVGVPWNEWGTGLDMFLKWCNLSRNADGSTAGTQLAGTIHNSPNLMDGVLFIEIKTTLGVLKNTIQVAVGSTYTYTQAQMVTDFGAEPASFDVVYYNTDGAYSSDPKTVRMTRR